MQTSVNKKTLLLSLLLLVTGSAWAGWEEIGTTRIGTGDQLTFYVDRATIRKDGNMRKIWELTDRKQRSKTGAMSIRARFEFDCEGERVKTIALSSHAEPMANGVIIDEKGGDLGGWRDVPPETTAETILKIVCAQ